MTIVATFSFMVLFSLAPLSWRIALAAPDNTGGMALLGATVLIDGALWRGSGATAADNPSTGVYTVTFDRDISECLYAAAPLDDVFVRINSLSGDTISFNARNGAGTLVATQFSVVVFCPK